MLSGFSDAHQCEPHHGDRSADLPVGWSVPGGRDLLLLDLCLDLIYAVYLLLMLEMSYLHPERRTEIVTRRRVIRSRLRSPLYWLKCENIRSASPVFPQLGLEPNHAGLASQSLFLLEELLQSKTQWHSKNILKLLELFKKSSELS